MTIKIGIIGLGYWGPNLVRAFNQISDVKITQLVDSDSKRLSFASKIVPNAKLISSIDEALKEDADAYVLATPAETHCTIGLKILEAGKDLFVEKPIALNFDDAMKLVESAEKREQILMVGHLLLYHPAYTDIKTRLDKGEFGELRYLYARRVNLGIVRSTENALWSLAPHDIAVANWLTGQNPVSVQAVGSCYLQENIEDVSFYTLKYPNGVIFHGHVSWLDPQKVRELSVIGTEKMAVLDDTEATEKVKIYNRTVETQRQPFLSYGQFLSIRTGDVHLPYIPSTEPLTIEAKHFVECVSKRIQPLTNGQSAANVVKILNALTQSIKNSGGWIDI